VVSGIIGLAIVAIYGPDKVNDSAPDPYGQKNLRKKTKGKLRPKTGNQDENQETQTRTKTQQQKPTRDENPQRKPSNRDENQGRKPQHGRKPQQCTKTRKGTKTQTGTKPSNKNPAIGTKTRANNRDERGQSHPTNRK
jgi:hypothetical protein